MGKSLEVPGGVKFFLYNIVKYLILIQYWSAHLSAFNWALSTKEHWENILPSYKLQPVQSLNILNDQSQKLIAFGLTLFYPKKFRLAHKTENIYRVKNVSHLGGGQSPILGKCTPTCSTAYKTLKSAINEEISNLMTLF